MRLVPERWALAQCPESSCLRLNKSGVHRIDESRLVPLCSKASEISSLPLSLGNAMQCAIIEISCPVAVSWPVQPCCQLP